MGCWYSSAKPPQDSGVVESPFKSSAGIEALPTSAVLATGSTKSLFQLADKNLLLATQDFLSPNSNADTACSNARSCRLVVGRNSLGAESLRQNQAPTSCHQPPAQPSTAATGIRALHNSDFEDHVGEESLDTDVNGEVLCATLAGHIPATIGYGTASNGPASDGCGAAHDGMEDDDSGSDLFKSSRHLLQSVMPLLLNTSTAPDFATSTAGRPGGALVGDAGMHPLHIPSSVTAAPLQRVRPSMVEPVPHPQQQPGVSEGAQHVTTGAGTFSKRPTFIRGLTRDSFLLNNTITGGNTACSGYMLRTATGRGELLHADNCWPPFQMGNPLQLQIGELLGRGGCGSVYRGQWQGRSVAVKVVQQVMTPPAGACAGGGVGCGGGAQPLHITTPLVDYFGSSSGREAGKNRNMENRDGAAAASAAAAAAAAAVVGTGPRAPYLPDAYVSVKRLRHPNVLRTYAYAVLSAAPQLDGVIPARHEHHVVLELCDGGSLRGWLDRLYCSAGANGEGARGGACKPEPPRGTAAWRLPQQHQASQLPVPIRDGGADKVTAASQQAGNHALERPAQAHIGAKQAIHAQADANIRESLIHGLQQLQQLQRLQQLQQQPNSQHQCHQQQVFKIQQNGPHPYPGAATLSHQQVASQQQDHHEKEEKAQSPLQLQQQHPSGISTPSRGEVKPAAPASDAMNSRLPSSSRGEAGIETGSSPASNVPAIASTKTKGFGDALVLKPPPRSASPVRSSRHASGVSSSGVERSLTSQSVSEAISRHLPGLTPAQSEQLQLLGMAWVSDSQGPVRGKEGDGLRPGRNTGRFSGSGGGKWMACDTEASENGEGVAVTAMSDPSAGTEGGGRLAAPLRAGATACHGGCATGDEGGDGMDDAPTTMQILASSPSMTVPSGSDDLLQKWTGAALHAYTTYTNASIGSGGGSTMVRPESSSCTTFHAVQQHCVVLDDDLDEDAEDPAGGGGGMAVRSAALFGDLRLHERLGLVEENSGEGPQSSRSRCASTSATASSTVATTTTPTDTTAITGGLEAPSLVRHPTHTSTHSSGGLGAAAISAVSAIRSGPPVHMSAQVAAADRASAKASSDLQASPPGRLTATGGCAGPWPMPGLSRLGPGPFQASDIAGGSKDAERERALQALATSGRREPFQAPPVLQAEGGARPSQLPRVTETQQPLQGEFDTSAVTALLNRRMVGMVNSILRAAGDTGGAMGAVTAGVHGVGPSAAAAAANTSAAAAVAGVEATAAAGAVMEAATDPMEPSQLRHLVTALDCLAEIASGLSHLHDAGMVHGDVKSGNVLLKMDSKHPRGFVLKLADFGFSRVLENGSHTYLSRPSGTLAYLSPEMLTAYRQSAAADQYAFGLLVWEVVTTQPLFRGLQTPQLLYAKTHNADWRYLAWPSWCPAEVRTLARRCAEYQPAARLTAAEARSQLEALKGHYQDALTHLPDCGAVEAPLTAGVIG